MRIAEKMAFLILIDCCPFQFNIKFNIIIVVNFLYPLANNFQNADFQIICAMKKYSKKK